MTNDNPDWRVFFNMLRCMYHEHPVKTDIAGTLESIAEINAELLYKCYNTFYNLNNMVLSIAGNISADEVLAVCDEMLMPCGNNALECVFPDEPETIVKPFFSEKQPVGASVFNLGYKCIPCSGIEKIKKCTAAAIAGELLTDPSSDMYQKLLKDGIINSTFVYEVFSGDGYFTLILSGESEKPEIVKNCVISEIQRMLKNGITENDFRRFQKTLYASLIRELNNVEAVSNAMLCSHFDGVSPFANIDVLSDITSCDVLEFIRSELLSEKLVLSVIERKVD